MPIDPDSEGFSRALRDAADSFAPPSPETQYAQAIERGRRLRRHGIPYTITPGVPAFAAAAAALGRELTVPGIAQSVVLTRMPGRASSMPEGERLATFAASGATPYLSTKLVTGRFFMERMLPETHVHLARIQSGCATTMELAAEAF